MIIMSTQRQVSQKKVETVKRLHELLESHNTIGIVEMSSIGAKSIQKLRSDLRSRARIVVAKNTLMRKALSLSKVKGTDLLAPSIKGSVAFLFTNDSPYSIANYLDRNKVAAPAKGGQISPKVVIVPKTNTGQPPGTIISLLNSVGLPTRIEGGTVAIPQDTQVLDVGDVISGTLASILTQLGIEPFEVGLSLNVVLENGEIIPHDELIIDFDAIRNDLIYAHQSAVGLSLKSGFITSDTGSQLIASAHSKALALAGEIGYLTDGTVSRVFGVANAKVQALAKALEGAGYTAA